MTIRISCMPILNKALWLWVLPIIFGMIACGSPPTSHEKEIRLFQCYWVAPIDPVPMSDTPEDRVAWIGEDDNNVAYLKGNNGVTEHLLTLDLKKRKINSVYSKLQGTIGGGVYLSTREEFPNFHIEYKGTFHDVGYTTTAGWPFPNKFEKVHLNGFFGDVVIYDRRKIGLVKLAEIEFDGVYVQDILDKFLYGPCGNYLLFQSHKNPKYPTLYFFKHEE